jgi:hypothetical protein
LEYGYDVVARRIKTMTENSDAFWVIWTGVMCVALIPKLFVVVVGLLSKPEAPSHKHA